jgi:hypothetical protein
MNILEKKQEIKTEIDRVEDEKLLEDILTMLHRDDEGIPEWHKQILEERLEKYESGNAKMKDWEDVKKSL